MLSSNVSYIPIEEHGWLSLKMKNLDLIISEVKKFDLADEKRQLDASLFAPKQKLAIIKAVAYVISSDSIITSEEQKFFIQLLAVLEANKDMVKDAFDCLDDNEMLYLLSNVTEEQEAFVMNCLAAAAMSDEELADEERAFLVSFNKNDLSNSNFEICKQLLTV